MISIHCHSREDGSSTPLGPYKPTLTLPSDSISLTLILNRTLTLALSLPLALTLTWQSKKFEYSSEHPEEIPCGGHGLRLGLGFELGLALGFGQGLWG